MWSKDKRLEAFRHYVQKGFKSDSDLYEYIKNAMEMHIPNASVCEGHVSPMRVIADFFFHRVKCGLLWASRGGGKTQDIAILNVLDAAFRKNCEVAHVAAARYQADRGLDYTKTLLELAPFNTLLTQNVAHQNKFINGSKIEILTGSKTGVNSFHPTKSRFDEVDLVQDPGILEEFFCTAMSKTCKECQNAPPEVIAKCQSCRGKGQLSQAQVCLASTRKTMTGVMQSLISDIATGTRDMKLYPWCILESMQTCYDECSQCKLYTEGCGGKAHKSMGFMTKNDTIQKRGEVSKQTWIAQYLNLKPDTEGLVYADFAYDMHVTDIKPNANFPTITCHDFGVSDHYVCLWIQIDPSTNTFYVIGELVMNMSPSRIYLEATLREEQELGVMAMWRACDKRALAWIQEFSEMGITLVPTAGNGIDEGIQEVRRCLCPAFGEPPKLYIDRSCSNTISEFQRYKATDIGKPNKDDHCMDAIRYGLFSLKIWGVDLTPASHKGERDLPDFAKYQGSGFNELSKIQFTF